MGQNILGELIGFVDLGDDLVWDKHTGELIGFVDLGDDLVLDKHTGELIAFVDLGDDLVWDKHTGELIGFVDLGDDLVWDKHTGELIGFVDLGDVNLNYASFNDVMGKCFDCCNGRNTKEYREKIKSFLKPYSNINDERFDWLENDFLKYFSDWKVSIENRPGDFTQNAKSKIVISWQTYEGLQITTYSLIEFLEFPLQFGVPYVFSEKCSQDDLKK